MAGLVDDSGRVVCKRTAEDCLACVVEKMPFLFFLFRALPYRNKTSAV